MPPKEDYDDGFLQKSAVIISIIHTKSLILKCAIFITTRIDSVDKYYITYTSSYNQQK